MEKRTFEEVKQELEIKKLQKEIEQIENLQSEFEKKWYKKPQWIIAITPIIVAIATLTVAWASGFLQSQALLNKIQENNFQRKKDSISKVITKLIKKSDSIKKINDSVLIKNTDLKQEVVFVKKNAGTYFLLNYLDSTITDSTDELFVKRFKNKN